MFYIKEIFRCCLAGKPFLCLKSAKRGARNNNRSRFAEASSFPLGFVVACDRGALFVAGLFLGDSLLLRSLVPLVPGGRGPAFAMANAGLRLVGVRNANAIDRV